MARHRRRNLGGAVLLALFLLPDAFAFAHPFGQKPVLVLRRFDALVDTTWVAAEDDTRALGEHVGAGPVRYEAYASREPVVRYFRRNLRVEAGGRLCEQELASVTQVSNGYSFRSLHRCEEVVSVASVRATLLHDIDENYQTLYLAVTDGERRNGAFTVASPEATIDFGGAAAEPSPEPSRPSEGSRADRILATLQGSSGSATAWGALGLAFVLGALHGLTPGHGKTITAAYLVGAGGTIRQALLLGGIVSGTHALAVGLLGGITVALGALQPDHRIGAALEIAAGVLILGLGALMLRPRRHDHVHAHAGAAVPPPAGRLAAIGVVGGLVPGPEAVAIALVAFSIDRWVLGAALIAAFSVGLAAVVLGVALAAVRGGALVRRASQGRWTTLAPRVAAVVFVAMGVFVLANGVRNL